MKKRKKSKIFIYTLCILIAVSAAVTAISFTVLHKGPFTGTVTETGTGIPVADVCITDGRHVTKTDKNGKFELKGWHKSHFIALTVPSGYQTEQFYLPIDKTKQSYDFTLDKSSITAQQEHSFLQISDTEIGENGTGEWLDSLKTIIKESKPAFLIHTGDICYEAGLKKHIQEMNTSTMGCTVRYVIGNHDYVEGKYGEELYESLYGPVWYSFDIGNTHYAVTSFQTGSDYKSFYNKNDRWKWLQNDLSNVDENKKVVIFNHTKAPKDDYVLSFGKNELDLKKHNLAAWVFGHYHYNYVYENEGVINISAPRPDCGGIDSSPAGARLIHVSSDGSISTKMIYYDLDQTSNPKNTLWNTKLEGNILFCDTATDGNFMYTASSFDDYPNEQSKVYCINKADGKIEWSYKTTNSVKNNIIIYEGYVIAQDTEGNVYCLDKANGSSIWQKKIDLGNSLGSSSGICENDGIIFTGTSRVITAMDIKTGNIVWSTNRDKGENSPAQFIICDDKLIVSSHWDSLCALNLSDGKELWSNSDDAIRFRSSTPICIDGKLLVADSNAIMLVDSQNGKIISKKTFDDYNFSSSAQPLCKDGTAYIATADNGLIAYHLKDEKILWSCKTGENILFTAPYVGKGKCTVEATPVLSGGNIIFGANDGKIYSVDIKNGEIKQTYSMGSAVMGKIVTENNKIYCTSFDGYAACFKQ